MLTSIGGDTMGDIGVLITGLVTLVGLFTAFNKLIILPVTELTVSVTRLNNSIDYMTKEQTRLSERVSGLNDDVKVINIKLARNHIN